MKLSNSPEQKKPSISAQPPSPEPAITPTVPPQELTKFFKHVSYGEQTEAEEMLKSNPKLVLARGNLTDCSKRTWKGITAFQYAVLALDYHMWTMLLKYLEAPQIRAQLRAQLEELSNNAILNEDGWVIKSTWTNKWPAVGWTKLIEALDIYIKNYDSWTAEQSRTHWRQQIGGAQLILPAHVINEYRHPSRPLHPFPKWGNNEASLPRQGVSDWLIAENGKYNLYKDFAWARGGNIAPESWGGGAPAGGPQHDVVRCRCVKCSPPRFTPQRDRRALYELLRARVEQARILLETKLQTKPSSTPAPPQINPKELAAFFKHVGFGEQDEAEAMLKINPTLATARGDLIDCGCKVDAKGKPIFDTNREFKQITGFQYAVWALDFQMWMMIKKYISKEEIRAQLEQLTRKATLHEQRGWVIISDAAPYWESCSWTPLINAIDELIKNQAASGGWGDTLINQMHKHIGGAQLILPAHVINEYCYPSRPFAPCPQWSDTEPELPRTGIAYWFKNSRSKLGKDCVWCRACCSDRLFTEEELDNDAWSGGPWCWPWGMLKQDGVAVSTLLKSRTAQARLLLDSVGLSAKASSFAPKPRPLA